MDEEENNFCKECEKPIQFEGLCSKCVAEEERQALTRDTLSTTKTKEPKTMQYRPEGYNTPATKPTHTPGPWNATDDQRGEFVIDATHQYICGVSYWAEGRQIEKGWLTRDEAEVNARLIAEAPALLAFAKKAHMCFSVPATGCETCQTIARAEGKS